MRFSISCLGYTLVSAGTAPCGAYDIETTDKNGKETFKVSLFLAIPSVISNIYPMQKPLRD